MSGFLSFDNFDVKKNAKRKRQAHTWVHLLGLTYCRLKLVQESFWWLFGRASIVKLPKLVAFNI